MHPNAASQLALFLLRETGNTCGRWEGPMAPEDQQALFGQVLDPTWLAIDGSTEVISASGEWLTWREAETGLPDLRRGLV